MKRNNRQPDPERLEVLAKQAKDYALHMMRTTGSVPPTVIADTEEGFVFCMPSALADDAAKDRFAEVAKLFAVAYRAQALVMIVEAWVRLPDSRGHLDPSIRPSEAADRKEVVALMLEDGSISATRLIPIIRDSNEAFTDLGPDTPLQTGEAEGRFSKLMPRHKPSADDCAKAKRTLFSIGMNVENRGFDPTMN
ncbi:MAG: hypothetical protein RLZZ505_2664 [Verrucomicrobiota bacterium]